MHKPHKTQIRLLGHAILVFIDNLFKIYWLIELNINDLIQWLKLQMKFFLN